LIIIENFSYLNPGYTYSKCVWNGRQHGGTKLAEVTELLVSELVTNAHKTTVEQHLGTPIRLRLSSNQDQVLIEVWDALVVATPKPLSSTTQRVSRNVQPSLAVHSRRTLRDAPSERGLAVRDRTSSLHVLLDDGG
jgi:hypothetical protein